MFFFQKRPIIILCYVIVTGDEIFFQLYICWNKYIPTFPQIWHSSTKFFEFINVSNFFYWHCFSFEATLLENLAFDANSPIHLHTQLFTLYIYDITFLPF